MPQRILCPIDFSGGSQLAVQTALEMLDPGGELVLLHVFQPPIYYGPDTAFPDALFVDLQADAEQALDAWKHDAEMLGAERVTLRLRIGSPWHEIIAGIRAVAADLVVIATHGRTGFSHVLLGSVVEKVVRHSPCPVYVVRARALAKPAPTPPVARRPSV